MGCFSKYNINICTCLVEWRHIYHIFICRKLETLYKMGVSSNVRLGAQIITICLHFSDLSSIDWSWEFSLLIIIQIRMWRVFYSGVSASQNIRILNSSKDIQLYRPKFCVTIFLRVISSVKTFSDGSLLNAVRCHCFHPVHNVDRQSLEPSEPYWKYYLTYKFQMPLSTNCFF